jgi:dihydrodipicolinate synthase/N-acetylneuraminate lyase
MATNQFQIDGIIPIIPTPFHEDETVDCQSLRGLIEFARTAGACAVCLPAYASEFYKLSETERRLVVEEAVAQAAGRIPVIGQVNYPSARQAVETAIYLQKAGASAIAAAVPRMFGMAERDLNRYFDRLLSVIEIPLIIQDFNPGGPTISPDFILNLHRCHPHFRFVKLEDPLMGAKVKAIREITQDEVGVLEGWGGMYMMELIPAGICGVMPGLGLTDLLARVFRLVKQGLRDQAYPIFQGVLPQIVFCLQHMELFHHSEKMLLQSRGVMPSIVVRDLQMDLEESDKEYISFLNHKMLDLLDQLGLPRNPAAVKIDSRP